MSEKRDLVIRKSDSGVEVDFINRRLGHRGEGVKLGKVTIVFPGVDAPEWFIKPAANLTFIRFQDKCRDLTDAERIELDGHQFDGEQFWAERSERKTRGPVKLSAEKVAGAVQGMTADQLANLAELLKGNEDFSNVFKTLLNKKK